MRKFQSRDGYRFWNIDVNGSVVTITSGNVGMEGRTSGKQQPSPSRARSAADKLIREKLKQGYKEIPSRSRKANVLAAEAPAEVVPPAEALAFEEALKEQPDDATGWLAYADYLTEHNDPRGEFIQVQVALEDESRDKAERKQLQQREAELLKEHERDWLGDLADHLLDQDTEKVEPIEYRWRRGFLYSVATFALGTVPAQALARSAEARFLTELRVHEVPFEMVGSPNLSQLRVFQIGADEEDERLNEGERAWYSNIRCYAYSPGIEDIIAGMTRIEELHLHCKEYDPEKVFALPNLTRLRILRAYHLGVRGAHNERTRYEYPLDVLARNPALTNLTHLLFHPHIPEYRNDDVGLPRGRSFLPLEQVRAVLWSKYLPKLTHLQIRLSDMGDAGVREIIASGILKRLKWLDLRHGGITDEGAKLFAECPDTRNLECLDLSRNGVTAKGRAMLRKAKVNAVVNQSLTATEVTQMQYLYDGDGE